ncbi:unnamed protein product [Scytosiphon promiscuus]
MRPPLASQGIFSSRLSFFCAVLITGAAAAAAAAATTAAAAGAPAAAGRTGYTEDLTIERLGRHHVGARFVFRSHWVPQARHRCQDHEDWHRGDGSGLASGDGDAEIGKSGKLCHFEAVFPRAVGVLLDRFKMRDLSLQMSKGKWDTAEWGNGPGAGASGEYTPGGAEMWARLPVEDAWESWIGLRRSLSGLYCSSLDSMDETRVHTPAKMTMPGENSQNHNGTTVLRGTLPREPVCTENLIPLIKMLPCRSKTGLGRLLHPTRLFQSDYHSISVRASATFSDAADDAARGDVGGNMITSLTLEQTVLAVFRPRPHLPLAISPRLTRGLGSRSTSGNRGGGTSDAAAGREDGTGAKPVPEAVEDWSVSSLLSPPISAVPNGEALDETDLQLEACPVASRTAIHVVGGGGGARAGSSKRDVVTRVLPLVPAGEATGARGEDAESSTTPPPSSESSSLSEFLHKRLWDVGTGGSAGDRGEEQTLGDGNSHGTAASAVSDGATDRTSPAVARLDHYLSGRGGTRGVSVSSLVNTHPSSGALVDFLQPVPYYMVPLLGTLRARLVPSSLSMPSSSPEDPAAAAAAGPLVSLAQNITLTPGDRRRAAVVEARVWIPAASTLVLGFDFFKQFLTVDDFPPDPSRGFDVPPPLARFSFADTDGAFEVAAGLAASGTATAGCKAGVEGAVEGLGEEGGCVGVDAGGSAGEVGLHGEAGGGGRVVYAYGEAALLDTPQPDFSMPFNVITFTSTVITFFLGTAINLLVRKSASKRRKKKTKTGEGGGDASEEEEGGDRRRFGRLRGLLRRKFGFVRRSRVGAASGGRIREETAD